MWREQTFRIKQKFVFHSYLYNFYRRGKKLILRGPHAKPVLLFARIYEILLVILPALDANVKIKLYGSK